MAMNPPPVYPAASTAASAAEPTFTAAVAAIAGRCGRGGWLVAGAITTALAMKTTPAPCQPHGGHCDYRTNHASRPTGRPSR